MRQVGHAQLGYRKGLLMGVSCYAGIALIYLFILTVLNCSDSKKQRSVPVLVEHYSINTLCSAAVISHSLQK
jgi:hypothetical protein